MRVLYGIIGVFLVFVNTSNAQVLDLGKEKQLFVDDQLLVKPENVYLMPSSPIKREVVWRKKYDWESETSTFFTLIQDGAKIKMYYRGRIIDYTCYAESTDGVNFVTPMFSNYAYKQHKQTNIIWAGSESSTFTPFLDTNPKGLASERFKATAHGRSGEGLVGLTSADGIKWKRIDKELMSKEIGWYDTQNIVFWDNRTNQYISFTRAFFSNSNARVANTVYGSVRGIQYSTSSDFKNWSDPTQIQVTGERVNLYTSSITRYADAPNFLIGYPMRLDERRRKYVDNQIPGLSDVVLMSSRNGKDWFKFDNAWIRPGLDKENWSDRNMLPAVGLLKTSTDEYSLYVVEHYRKDVQLRRYTIPRDRFASIGTVTGEGSFETPLVKFSGDNLWLNYSTSALGSIVIQIIDAQGKVLPGFSYADFQPLFGDALDEKVNWKGGLNSLKGKAIKLQFKLQDANLYAIQFK